MPIEAAEWQDACRLGPRPGFTPQISVLVGMMHYARLTTREAVEGLSVQELDALPPGFSNSIGMLLAHMAATDRLYQAASFEGRSCFEADDYAPYVGAMTFGWKGEPVRGRTLDDLLAELDATRAETLRQLAEHDDDWLTTLLTAPGFDDMNQHWAWFHVMEDELSHRGQIRILRKALALQTPPVS
ncbi:DinB family protein [Deinococcus sonorensis]|uniref:DinB family protein n=2 Tax=Deinococcus sonorensis TaxID=309891 RepID=A0AAU7U957_9DEIO